MDTSENKGAVMEASLVSPEGHEQIKQTDFQTQNGEILFHTYSKGEEQQDPSGSYLIQSNIREDVSSVDFPKNTAGNIMLEPGQKDQQSSDTSASETEQSSRQDEQTYRYAHLCHLLLEGGAYALRHVFNLIHPAISLANRLSKPDALKVLRRLRLQNVISGKQWETIYPKQRKAVSSMHYDTPLLMVLLQNICHMSPPYPNGWRGAPLPSDNSISADVARVSYFRNLLASKQEISDGEYEAYCAQIADVLVRLGGTPIKAKLDRLNRNGMQNQVQVQNTWINKLKVWDNEAGEYNTSDTTNTDSNNNNTTTRVSTSNGSLQLPRVVKSATVSSDWGESLSSSMNANSGAQLHRAVYSSSLPTRNRTKGSEMSPKQTLSQADRSVLLKFYKVLVENIKSETVVGKLVQAGILTHEEKNSINLAPRNPDRMKALLGLLPKKSTQALNAFCEAIKYRHTSIYDQLVKARQQAQTKPDEVSECCTYLKSRYKALYNQYKPIAWHQQALGDLGDFYVKPYIADFYGRTIDAEKVLDKHSKCNNPRRVLIEGASGTGKSTLCHYLAYAWATGKIDNLKRFKLVFVLDLRRFGDKSVAQAILEQCLEGAKRTASEINSIVKSHQNEVLFLLDGFEDISEEPPQEIISMLHRSSFKHCYTLLTSGSGHVGPSLAKNFDTRLVLMGINTDLQESLVQKYMSITDTPQELYAALSAKVTSGYDITVRTMALNPLLNLCMCLICEMQGALNFKTVSLLMTHFMTAIKKLYCTKHHIKPTRDIILTENVDKCLLHLGEQAFKHITHNKHCFEYEMPMDTHDIESYEPIFNFGLLKMVPRENSVSRSPDKWYFTNRAFQEFLASWHLSRLRDDSFTEFQEMLVNEKCLRNVCTYYCGLLASNDNENNAENLSRLFDTLGEKNRELWRATPTINRSTRQSSLTRTTLHPSGRLGDFTLSLRCISEVRARGDVVKPLLTSFPQKISMRPREVPDIRVISGLAHVLQAPNSSSITELDLRLDHFAKYHEYTFLALAASIERSQSVSSLKLHWTNDELLSLFLAKVFGKNESIKSVRCFDGLRRPGEKISATAWSHMRLACNNMKHVEQFHFTHCKNSAMVTSVLRNTPYTVREINIAGCAISQVSTQEISSRLEKSHFTHTLNLSGIELKRTDFMYLCQGLKLSLSLRDFNLSDTNLDNNCFSQLAEAVKFNKSMTRLDLSHSQISDDSCKAIGHAVGINQSLMELVLIDCSVSQEGLQLLQKLKRSNLLVLGLDIKSYLGNMYNLTGNLRFTLPAIKMTAAQ